MIAAAVRRLHALLVRGLEALLVALFVLLTADVLWGVVSRYVLGAQSRWTEELATYLLIWVSLLGASVAYAEGGHLGIDYLVDKFQASARRAAAVSVEVLVAVFALTALVHGGWVLVAKTLESGQMSPSLGIEVGYLYLAVPISGAFIVVFCAERLMRIFSGQELEPQGPPATDA